MSAFLLAGRTVLLTGGGRGIGRALLSELIAKGVRLVIVVGRDGARLQELKASFPQVDTFQLDLSDPAKLDGLIHFVSERASDLSVLINNAGTQVLADLIDPEGDRHLPAIGAEIAVNLSAPIQLTVALMPLLIGQPSAMIVNVTSGLALTPKQSSPVYCGTKAGLSSFTKALRYQAEARAPHVRIVEALPPLVETDMTRGRGRDQISPEVCAAEIVAGMEAGRDAVYVGKVKLLRAVQRLSPSLADRLMRDR